MLLVTVTAWVLFDVKIISPVCRPTYIFSYYLLPFTTKYFLMFLIFIHTKCLPCVLAGELPLLRNIFRTVETLSNSINIFLHPAIFRFSREMPEDVCTVCSGPASNRCSACKQVSYCSREHQKQDWKNHKNSCRPFEASIISSWPYCLFTCLAIRSVCLLHYGIRVESGNRSCRK